MLRGKKKVNNNSDGGEWDWDEMQRISTGVLGLTPNEFWSSQPRDIILMYEGLQMKREYEETKHLQTLIANRLNTAFLLNIHTKKTIRPEQLYELSCDKKQKEILSKEEIERRFNIDRDWETY